MSIMKLRAATPKRVRIALLLVAPSGQSLVRRYLLGVADVLTEARITCPEYGFSKVETMPTDACQHFYRREGCGALLRPLPGDWCVFCSYANSVCPPK